jgi:hypothetical protein
MCLSWEQWLYLARQCCLDSSWPCLISSKTAHPEVTWQVTSRAITGASAQCWPAQALSAACCWRLSLLGETGCPAAHTTDWACVNEVLLLPGIVADRVDEETSRQALARQQNKVAALEAALAAAKVSVSCCVQPPQKT